MSRVYSAPRRLFYFGARDVNVPGHFFWAPGGGMPPRLSGCPWTLAELDTKLCPPDPEQRQGAALVHHREGWTALASRTSSRGVERAGGVKLDDHAQALLDAAAELRAGGGYGV
jgi:hypothetical protein